MGNGSPLINWYFCSRHIKGNVVSRFATRPSLIRLMVSVDVTHHERRRWKCRDPIASGLTVLTYGAGTQKHVRTSVT